MNIQNEYLRILEKELSMETNKAHGETLVELHNAPLILNNSRRIIEVAKNSTVARIGNTIGHLCHNKIAYESVGAHTNLVRTIVNYALDFSYGWGVNTPFYDRREIDEAILMHDLPENEIGDIPDNGTQDKAAKAKIEEAYFDDFLNLHSPSDDNHCFYIKELLNEMNDQSTEEGRILYLADKTAAVIMMLCYDYLGYHPYAYENDEHISIINRAEMKLCELRHGGGYLLSELWTVDFLFARELTKYDDTGFFTAILIMTTLLVNGKWYNWREKQYLS